MNAGGAAGPAPGAADGDRVGHPPPEGQNAEGQNAGGQDAEGRDAFVLQLPAFEGPLDLLLHLIEREELDVTEVSLLAVTEQYLAHLRSGEQINLAALAGFVAVGARLLLLKSRALLPQDDEHRDDAEDGGDPADLIDALREYRRYRNAADHLRQLEDDHRTSYRREAPAPEVTLPTGLDRVTLDALVSLFRDVMERLPPVEEQPELARDPVRLADRVASLTAVLERESRASFRSLVERARSRLEVVVDFLAVLELIKAGFLRAEQDEAFGDIQLVRIEGVAAPTAEDLSEDLGDA